MEMVMIQNNLDDFENKLELKLFKIKSNTDNAYICECVLFAENEEEAWEIFSKIDEIERDIDIKQEIESYYYDISEVQTKKGIIMSSINIYY